MSDAAPLWLVGTSGWHYKHWRGDFYPQGLAAGEWLEHYAERFSTVELNSSFYRLPKASAWEQWRERVPPDFTFAVKASRYITHIQRLEAEPASIERFFEGALRLEERLGPVLYQLPPSFHCTEENMARLEAFIGALPKRVRHVFEFRHGCWFNKEPFALLERKGAGFCSFDMPGIACPLRATGGLLYMRFHGSGERYGGNYTEAMLEGWARRLREVGAGVKQAYIYFNNDIGGFAPHDAERLWRLLAGDD